MNHVRHLQEELRQAQAKIAELEREAQAAAARETSLRAVIEVADAWRERFVEIIHSREQERRDLEYFRAKIQECKPR